MMRLIDANRVTDILEQLQAHSLNGKMDIVNALYLISNTPTAYNVGMVIEELEKELADCGDCYEETGMRAAYIKAIEIIKRGETNER